MKRVIFTYILSIIFITSSLSYSQDIQLSDVLETPSDTLCTYTECDIIQTDSINDILTGTVVEMTTGSAVQLQESGTDINPMEAQAVSAAATQSITLSPSSFSMGNIPPNTAVTFSGAAALEISSKTNWTVRVSCPNFVSGSNAIPSGRVKVKASSSSTYVTLSSSPQVLMTGSRNWPRSGTYEIDYQITLLPLDPAGTDYLSSITYEISTN